MGRNKNTIRAVKGCLIIAAILICIKLGVGAVVEQRYLFGVKGYIQETDRYVLVPEHIPYLVVEKLSGADLQSMELINCKTDTMVVGRRDMDGGEVSGLVLKCKGVKLLVWGLQFRTGEE